MIGDRFVLHGYAFHWTTTQTRSLDIRSLRVSLDMDRVPFVSISLVCGPTDALTWQWLDPRNTGTTGGRLLWGVDRWDADTERFTLGLPYRTAPNTFGFPAGSACIRKRSRNPITGEVTVEATSYEVLMDDKRRIASTETTIATAVNLFDMVLAALADVSIGTDLNASINDATGAGGVLIPAGERRKWLQGQTWAEFYESEMQSVGRRLYDSARGNDMHIRLDTDAPYLTGQPATLTLRDGPDGHIIDIEEVTDREDWADGVLGKFSYTNSGGTAVTAYQPAPAGGSNTKGIVVTRDRPAPSSSVAASIRTRTLIRGQTYDIRATAELAAHPGQSLTATLAGVNYTAQVRAVEFEFPQGEMTIKAQVQ